MLNADQISQIRSLIARNNLSDALLKMRQLLENNPMLNEAIHHSGRFYYIRKQLQLGLVSPAEADLMQSQIRFGLLELLQELEMEGIVRLPLGLAENLITDRNRWLESLQRELLKNGLSVSNRADRIIQYFGWLIEEFLRKMQTAEGQQYSLRAFSYMTEAWQNTLRYLSYIQLAQLLKSDNMPVNTAIARFIAMQDTRSTSDGTAGSEREIQFDYLNLLLVCTDLLRNVQCFVPEIAGLVYDFTDPDDELFDTVLFLDENRRRLLAGDCTEDACLPELMDEYRTALVTWLRRITFLAKYRLVSIKEISLNYRLGSRQQFVHLYGELHGVYNQAFSNGEDYNLMSVDGVFTYSQSVLLFKGNDIQSGWHNIGNPDTYLSLSPLLIDQSVFAAKNTDTPEIYYYAGRFPDGRQYEYALYKNELPLGSPLPSNKKLQVKSQNSQQPKLDGLFEQLNTVFRPYKNTGV